MSCYTVTHAKNINYKASHSPVWNVIDFCVVPLAIQELLMNNCSVFTPLRHGTIGAVEIVLVQKGAMLINGLPSKPAAQGKHHSLAPKATALLGSK